MNSTIEVLRNEAKRLRSLAQRMDALASELGGTMLPIGGMIEQPTTQWGPIDFRLPDAAMTTIPPFKGMTQHAAILKALELYGPQTTRELFERLNAGGMAFKKRVYITAILGRLKDVVERTPDNKIKLKEQNLTVKSVP